MVRIHHGSPLLQVSSFERTVSHREPPSCLPKTSSPNPTEVLMLSLWSQVTHVTAQDFFVIGFLAFLEGILSIDNALVLALMASHLPRDQQRKALTFGLVGSVVFRLAALSIATQLIQWHWVKWLGGGYLLFIAIRHFYAEWKQSRSSDEEVATQKKQKAHSFWKTVFLIELMDIAFAVDSILAAVALTQKLWIVFVGGMLGVILMRFAASVFLKVLDRFPGFETTAYVLILIIGAKVTLEGFDLPQLDFHSARSPAFWIFWSLMMLGILSGFRKPKSRPKSHL